MHKEMSKSIIVLRSQANIKLKTIGVTKLQCGNITIALTKYIKSGASIRQLQSNLKQKTEQNIN